MQSSKPSPRWAPTTMEHRLPRYDVFTKVESIGARRRCSKTVNKNVGRSQGKAALKSKKTGAPLSCAKAISIIASSKCTTLLRIECPDEKPRCIGEIHRSNSVSTRMRTTMAGNRLPTLVKFKGRMCSEVQKPPTSSSVPEKPLGKNTIMLSLQSGQSVRRCSKFSSGVVSW